ncbi:D-alanine--D-alanine ligase [Thalassotalea atypica]|uniref:D-alanine--D-alanine ligase n=1 Tax=Thalassotalea atypica TaxID=2054316 RepID=UPI0025745B58|nr:D-alanine--D-alanine ligase [Thalassotalea atypica]
MLQQEKIAVLYGGTSAEREVSIMSGEAIARGLEKAGFDVELVDPKDTPVMSLTSGGFDRAFIALHGRGGEDGTMQGALDTIGIPYTGSDVLGSALCMDKVRSKLVFKALNIPTAAFEVVEKATYQTSRCKSILEGLGGKAMVKPANEGSSIGMSIVTNSKELDDALIKAFKYDEQVLIEAWINGPEYTIAILGEQALPVIHMETPREFYDYEAKYQSTSTLYHCPSGLAEQTEQELQAIALKAFKAVGAKGWGRVDVMQSEQGQWQVLEVNTSPGMTETSLVPKAAKVAGLDFPALVTKIVSLSKEQ